MRYVLLLLIFCVTFGVLDSVPRYRGDASAMGSASTAAPMEPAAQDLAAHIHASAPIAYVHHPVDYFRQSGAARFAALRHHIVRAVTATRGTVAPRAAGVASLPNGREPSNDAVAAAAGGASSSTMPSIGAAVPAGRRYASAENPADLSVPAYHAATKDIAHGTVEPGEAMKPNPVDEASMDDVATTDMDRLSPSVIAMAQVPGNLDAPVDEKESLADFARLAKDMTGSPLLRDTIRNTLMDAHGLQFGGIAGLNWSGASATNASGKVPGRSLTGVTLGVFADAPVTKHLSIRPKAVYEYQGYQPNVNGQPVNLHVAYLHIAPDVVFHTDWLSRRFFVGGGPYFAYALNGTYNLKGIDNDMVFGSGAGANLRQTDAGVGVMAGLLMDRNFVLGAHTDLGMLNIAPEGPAHIHTRSFGLSLMYVFRNRPLF